MRRGAGRLLLILVVALIGWAGTAAVARADPLNLCSDAPAPVSPRSGIGGLLGGPPEPVPPKTPDPFTDPTVTLGEVYGYDWSWSNYDLGCGSDFLRDPVAVTNTQSANLAAGVMSGFVASLAAAEHLAIDSPITWAQQVVTEVSMRLRALILGESGSVGWLPLAVISLGVLIAWRARRANYAATARAFVVFIAAVLLTVITLLYPTAASQTLDRGVHAVADAAGAPFDASLSDTVNRDGAYRTWLTGYFGDPDSELATTLGPRLLAATHYSWTEVVQIDQNPSARAPIDKAKAAEFKAIAAEVEAKSPSAYEMFTGRADRFGPALLGLVITICMGLFALVAFLMILIGRIMMQALLIAAPIAAVLGVLPPGYVVLQKMWGLFTAAILAIAKFVLAAGVMALVLTGLAAAEMPGAERLVWILVATIVGFALTKPFRSIKTLLPGVDPNRKYFRDLAGKLATAAAVSQGVQSGINAADPVPASAAPTPTSAPPPAFDPLPTPEWHQTPGAGDRTEALPSVTAAGTPAGGAQPGWAGVLPARPSPLELDSAPAAPATVTAPPAVESQPVDHRIAEPGDPRPASGRARRRRCPRRCGDPGTQVSR